MGSRARVLVTEPIHERGVALLREQCQVVMAPDPSSETVGRLLAEADGVLVRVGRISAAMIANAPTLRVIARHGVGVDNVDIAAATARGIAVVYTPEANSESVAEHALGLILALTKTIVAGHQAQRQGRFQARHDLVGVELVGRTLGLVGAGRIGSRVAAIAQAAFDMRVLVYDPYLTAARADEQRVKLVHHLDDLLGEADVVSIHTPLTEDTRGMIGADQLARMKPGAYLVNTSRGGVVDEAALADGLRSGQLAGAALDVFAQEPPPADHPLFGLDNAIVTPHLAAHTAEALERMAVASAEELLAVLRGDQPRWCVNPEVLVG